MRPVPQDVPVRLALAGLVGACAWLAMPAAASAQERDASTSCVSEIVDPFVAVPRARAAGAAIGVMVAEILDPFAALPARAATARIVSDIIDPFVTGGGAVSAASDILDPWGT